MAFLAPVCSTGLGRIDWYSQNSISLHERLMPSSETMFECSCKVPSWWVVCDTNYAYYHFSGPVDMDQVKWRILNKGDPRIKKYNLCINPRMLACNNHNSCYDSWLTLYELNAAMALFDFLMLKGTKDKKWHTNIWALNGASEKIASTLCNRISLFTSCCMLLLWGFQDTPKNEKLSSKNWLKGHILLRNGTKPRLYSCG